jgi:hypothetical protein
MTFIYRVREGSGRLRGLKIGKTESYLLDVVAREGCCHLTLLDPENVDGEALARIVKSAEEQGIPRGAGDIGAERPPRREAGFGETEGPRGGVEGADRARWEGGGFRGGSG